MYEVYKNMPNIASQKMLTTSYPDIRARLIQRGYTLRSFALAFGYSIPTTYCAARGTRAGVQTTRIRNHLLKFAYATTE